MSRLLLLASALAALPSAATPAALDRWVFLDGEEAHQSGREGDARRARAAALGHARALWFVEGGAAFVILDPALLDQARAALAPLERLGAQLGQLGERQGALGAQQGALGAEQGRLGARADREDVRRQMDELGRKMDALSVRMDALSEEMTALEVKLRAADARARTELGLVVARARQAGLALPAP